MVEVAGKKMKLKLHEGQLKAWDSVRRWVAIIAGTQSGKTSFGPHWLRREISRKGAGTYIVVTPTFPLLKLKALPEFLKLFREQLKLGDYKPSDRAFIISGTGEKKLFGKKQDEETRVVFGYAAKPDSLESTTAKGAWLDEAGQSDFKLGSWEAIQRRLSIHEGRALITTTPYNLGWLKTEIFDRWLLGASDIDVINFKSTMNPEFPMREYLRAQRTLPKWKFDMFYNGVFARPAGMIYEEFSDDRDIVEPFDIPDTWPQYMGVDFGGANTAAVQAAFDPGSSNLYLFREYRGGNVLIREHAKQLGFEATAIGGAPSEQVWRDEFSEAGLYIMKPPVPDVEVGIDKVVAAHKSGRYKIFSSLKGYLAEKQVYSRVLDANGNATDAIENKHAFHLLDAERYMMTYVSDMYFSENVLDISELENAYDRGRVGL